MKETHAEVESRLPSTRFGIRFKLFSAILGLSALTVVAGLVASLIFGEADRAMHRVSNASLPTVEAALRLSETGALIAAAAPRIVAAGTQTERAATMAALQEEKNSLDGLVDQLAELGASAEAIDELRTSNAAISVVLDQLDQAVAQRLDLSAWLSAAVTRLWQNHERFLDALEPMIDDAVFEMVITGERVTAGTKTSITDLVEGGGTRLQRLLTVNAEGNLVAGLLAEATHINDQAQMATLRERFEASADAIERNLQGLADLSGIDDLRAASHRLLAFGQSPQSVFSGHQTSETALNDAHDDFLSLLVPMIDDASFDLVVSTEATADDSAAAIAELIDTGVTALQRLLSLRADGNLLVGLLAEAATEAEESGLQPLAEQVTAVSDRLRSNLADPVIEAPGNVTGLPPGGLQAADQLRTIAGSLVQLATGNNNIFDLRRSELKQIDAAQSALDDSREQAADLRQNIADLVAVSEANSTAAAAQSSRLAELGLQIMVALTAVSLLVALGVLFLYVGRRIVAPLARITRAATLLASGDTTVDIPGRERRDELGRMAAALGVFRDAAIREQEANLAEIHEGRRRLSDAIESISEAFSLFDAQDKLVICNRRYRDLLHSGEASDIAPGMTYSEIICRSADEGYIVQAGENREDWIAEWLARHRDPGPPYTYRRGDGRWVLVSERRTQDGGTVGVYSDITELKEREEELAKKTLALEQLSAQLSKYLSPQVYESIFSGRQEVKVASQRKKLTVFFSDIASFTETTERMESEELTQLLNHYLTEMSRIALAHGATIDKYVGDAIVIFFGDPESRGVEVDALACVRMAIAMRERMRELQTVWRDSGVERPLRCRMGINTGYCTVGNFGSEDRMDYTIVGGGVNLAARLETAAPPGEILISYETYAHIKHHIACEAREPITVKGIPYPVSTFLVHDEIGGDQTDEPLPIEQRLKDLRLDLDGEGMSDEERNLTIAALRHAADRLSHR